MKLELITFKICPYGQRVSIALMEKGLDFNLNWISPKRPPAWLGDISPQAKVPVLRLDDKAYFDSAVISELVDELKTPRLLPRIKLERARHRCWIAYSQQVLAAQMSLYAAPTRKRFTDRLKTLGESLGCLEQALSAGPYFGGDHFSLVDAAYAPFFVRARIMETEDPRLAALVPESLRAWGQALVDRPSVQASIPHGFPRIYRAFIRGKGSWLLKKDD